MLQRGFVSLLQREAEAGEADAVTAVAAICYAVQQLSPMSTRELMHVALSGPETWADSVSTCLRLEERLPDSLCLSRFSASWLYMTGTLSQAAHKARHEHKQTEPDPLALLARLCGSLPTSPTELCEQTIRRCRRVREAVPPSPVIGPRLYLLIATLQYELIGWSYILSRRIARKVGVTPWVEERCRREGLNLLMDEVRADVLGDDGAEIANVLGRIPDISTANENMSALVLAHATYLMLVLGDTRAAGHAFLALERTALSSDRDSRLHLSVYRPFVS